MARFKTNDEHLRVFQVLCEKWLNSFGIKSYVTSFRRASMSAMATVSVRVNSRSARFKLATSWPEKVLPSLLERCAIHECLHVLTAQLVAEALPSTTDVQIPADSQRVAREEEALVVTLENFIVKYSRRSIAQPYVN